MKKFLLLELYFQMICTFAFAQYKPINGMSSVKFHVKNFGIRTDGMFKSLGGNITFDVDHPSEGKFDMFVDAASIDTDNDLRDSHLRDDGFFEVDRFPVISFVSRVITTGEKAETFNITGDLTIKGRTKRISFPFMCTRENERVHFAGSFDINRKDFDIGGSGVISDNVTIDLNVVAGK